MRRPILDDVRQWPFEVWNEPNLVPNFWTGTRTAYFELYEATRDQGLVASVDGREVVRVTGEGEPTGVGERLAEEALSRGADRILAGVR